MLQKKKTTKIGAVYISSSSSSSSSESESSNSSSTTFLFFGVDFFAGEDDTTISFPSPGPAASTGSSSESCSDSSSPSSSEVRSMNSTMTMSSSLSLSSPESSSFSSFLTAKRLLRKEESLSSSAERRDQRVDPSLSSLLRAGRRESSRTSGRRTLAASRPYAAATGTATALPRSLYAAALQQEKRKVSASRRRGGRRTTHTSFFSKRTPLRALGKRMVLTDTPEGGQSSVV